MAGLTAVGQRGQAPSGRPRSATPVSIDVCIDVHTGMQRSEEAIVCTDMCVDMCVDMWVDMRVDTLIDMEKRRSAAPPQRWVPRQQQ